ncbi:MULTISPECIES: aminotransferase class IV family protein [unclassified Streptomyces]|uniref:aminotransferase class IV family protein n=1 Tax=unclassified Streptomyces TaxID=2593676 RepID=UPI002DDB11C6|nr:MULTISPECIES: aminotransferase class IV family protein [unclassified Streptomyces]WSB75661.1 aminotransferase class IV family protein [Streptomyces sp. NBC_01775]WSS16054.1 aminotransferase class IV family protein [Streptomyces sp. NBC_01186]WSS44873.1 aminotransferase class IV family protein [Streptomyces sp. NBC_01187]
MNQLNGRAVDMETLRKLALVGYGHFTSVRVDNQLARGIELHLERLVRDCRTVFDAELDPGEVRGHLRQAVAGTTGALVARVTVFDPELEVGRPADSGCPSVLVTTREAGPLSPPPLRVRPVEYARDLPHVKHLGLFGALYARRTAQRAGFDDALFHGPDGTVSEGGTWNVGLIRAGRIVWPQADVLPGVTMALVRRSAHQHVTAPVTLQDAQEAEAAFATNTTVGVRPLSAIGATEMAVDHPLLREIQHAYRADPGERV